MERDSTAAQSFLFLHTGAFFLVGTGDAEAESASAKARSAAVPAKAEKGTQPDNSPGRLHVTETEQNERGSVSKCAPEVMKAELPGYQTFIEENHCF